MIKIEKKNIKNKGFYYLSEQINIGGKFKKIQVYVGKNIPNKIDDKLSQLEKKEIVLIEENISRIYKADSPDLDIYRVIEKTRIRFKYYFFQFNPRQTESFWRDFAIRFIFESNRIEGSRLSQQEVENIVKERYIKKSVDRKEILEVENSIRAFSRVRSGDFKLNQNEIKGLHRILVKGLGVPEGYKTENIIVNNKETYGPDKVKKEMTRLISWWRTGRKNKDNPLLKAIKFHQRFELIHPFSDGNGRVGRLILIWMLLQDDYGVILFKDRNRHKYFSALDLADQGRNIKLYRYAAEVYKNTFKECQKFISS